MTDGTVRHSAPGISSAATDKTHGGRSSGSNGSHFCCHLTTLIRFTTVILAVSVLLFVFSGCMVERKMTKTLPVCVKPIATMEMAVNQDTGCLPIPYEVLFPKPPAVLPFAVSAGDNIPCVLMYHLILDKPYSKFGGLFVRVADFEQQLIAMRNAGLTFLFADAYQKTAERCVMLTFDDGYEDNYTNLFPLLKKYDARATVFLVTDLIGTPGYLTREQIQEMADSGYVRFGSHTVSHDYLASIGDENRLRYELSQSKALIEELTGQPVESLAYPSGSYNDTVSEMAQEYYQFCYTTHSPASYPSPSDMEISRYYVSRDLSMDTFYAYINA